MNNNLAQFNEHPKISNESSEPNTKPSPMKIFLFVISLLLIGGLGFFMFIFINRFIWAYYLAVGIALIFTLFFFFLPLKKSKEAFIHSCQFTKKAFIWFLICIIGSGISIKTIHAEYFSYESKYIQEELRTLYHEEGLQEVFFTEFDGPTPELEILSKSSIFPMCSALRLIGMAQDMSRIFHDIQEDGSVFDYSTVLPSPAPYTGTDELYQLYQDTFTFDWDSFINGNTESYANEIKENISQILEQATTSMIWNFIFMKLSPFIFHFAVLEGVMKLTTLLILRKPLFVTTALATDTTNK